MLNRLPISHIGSPLKRGHKRYAAERSPEHLNFLPRKMHVLAISLRRFINSRSDEDIAEFSAEATATYMERSQAMWAEFEEGWKESAVLPMSNEQLEEAATFYGEVADVYLRHNAKLRERLSRLKANDATSATPAGTFPLSMADGRQLIHIQLAEPPSVIKFSGQEIEWANFRTQFEAEVHANPHLSNPQKLRKLLGALEGRAKQAIGEWPTTDDRNYELAWNALCRQYGNEYNTVRAHLQKLFMLRTIRQPSCEALRELLDVTRGSHRQLSLLLTPDKVAEYILLHRIEKLMDPESQTQWGMRRSTGAMPTLAEIYEFLELRASLLAAMPTTSSQREEQRVGPSAGKAFAGQERGRSAGRTNEMRPQCGLCAGERHWPFRCTKFKALPMAERMTYVNRHKMCVNCFSQKHSTLQCPDVQCPRCRMAHNSALCPRNTEIGGQSVAQRQTAPVVKNDGRGSAAPSAPQ